MGTREGNLPTINPSFARGNAEEGGASILTSTTDNKRLKNTRLHLLEIFLKRGYLYDASF